MAYSSTTISGLSGLDPNIVSQLVSLSDAINSAFLVPSVDAANSALDVVSTYISQLVQEIEDDLQGLTAARLVSFWGENTTTGVWTDGHNALATSLGLHNALVHLYYDVESASTQIRTILQSIDAMKNVPLSSWLEGSEVFVLLVSLETLNNAFMDASKALGDYALSSTACASGLTPGCPAQGPAPASLAPGGTPPSPGVKIDPALLAALAATPGQGAGSTESAANTLIPGLNGVHSALQPLVNQPIIGPGAASLIQPLESASSYLEAALSCFATGLRIMGPALAKAADWFSATDTGLAALLQELTNQLPDVENYGVASSG